MKLHCRLSPCLRPTLVGAALTLLAPAAWAQVVDQSQSSPNPAPATPPPRTAVPVTTTPGGDASQPIRLSPFEVHSEKDSGYYGANTLAGTRINSKIEDLGASITVVTKQQLLDTGAVDINDIFKYEANTEGTFDYTAQLSNALTNDQIQSSPQTATRVRGLSTPNMSVNGTAMTSRIPVDSYDLESVEISRGPNSTLFGLGSPSGTINLNTLNARLTTDSNTISFRGDSYGGWRTSFDFNRVILKDRIALRVAAVDGDKAFERKPSYDRTKRLYLTTTIRPLPWTTIRLIWEHFMEARQSPNALTPRDDVSEWIADGRPSWNPLNYTATVNGVSTQVTSTNENGIPGTAGALPAGLFSNTTNYTRPSMYIDAGQVQLWEINRLGTSNNPNTSTASNVRMLSGSGSLIQRGDINAGVLYQIPGINNKALYDWTKINAVSPDWNYDHATLYTASLEQEIAPNLYARAAWHLEDSNSYNRNIVNPPILQVDVNQNLLDGRPNPFFNRPFFQASEPTIFQSPEYNDNIQTQVTYDLDLPKLVGPHSWLRWLGEHRVLGYYESRRITDGTWRYREAIIDPNHSWLTAGALNYSNGAAIDRPTYRFYVGPNGASGFTPGYSPPKSGVSGNFNFNYNLANGTWVSEPAVFGTANYVASQSRQEITSRGAVIQSSFLDDRIVVTGGLRDDFNRTRGSNGNVINGATGFYDNGPTSTWQAWTLASGKTRTLGVVIKPLPWLGLFGDKSDSFIPQPQAIDLFDHVLPNTYGHGQDLGFYLSFFHDKLVLRASVYKTIIINDRNADGTIGSRIYRMDTYGSTFGSDRTSFAYWAYNAAANKLGFPTPVSFAGGSFVVDPSVAALANSWLQYPPIFLNTINAVNNGAALRGVNDTEAKGGEIEVDYNPSYNLNFKFTGAQTKAIQTSIENDLSDYIALRMPVWLAANDGLGDYFWTSTKYNNSSGQSFYTSAVAVPLQTQQAFLGTSNPQVKEYTWRALGTYRFSEGWLKNLAVGGDVRWDSQSVIGYYGGTPDPVSGVVRTLNLNHQVNDPARYSGDAFAYYNMKLDRGKIGMKIQFNWGNVGETGRLQVVNINPDGQPYNYRIIDPQQFVLTTTFSF